MSSSEIIERVAARGDGVTASGRFAPFGAPGDMLGPDDVLTAGPHHQVPPCRHFGACGGCRLQHLDDQSYAGFVRDRVVSALAAQGLSAPIRDVHLSPPRARRRATFHAERRGKSIAIGFSAAQSNQLVDLSMCHVVDEKIWDIINPLRSLLAERIGGKRRIDIHATLADQGMDLLIKGVDADDLSFAETLPRFAQAHQLARVAIDDGYGPENRWEPQPVTITLGGIAVSLPHGAFLQATEDGEAVLVDAVREAVGQARVIADLFAGLGTFALNLAGKVYAAEAGREPILALKAAGARASRPVFADHRDLYRRPLQPAELDRFEAVILDPPRAGAREQCVQIAQSRVPVIAYVSCNPSSFARDAKLLCENGYSLDWVKPVGQFRWSTHVELAARLSRQG